MEKTNEKDVCPFCGSLDFKCLRHERNVYVDKNFGYNIVISKEIECKNCHSLDVIQDIQKYNCLENLKSNNIYNVL